MSRFLNKSYSKLSPYTPGEQPKDIKYLKLNTNESPFPPSPKVSDAAELASRSLNLYQDPENTKLREKLAEVFRVKTDEIIVTNGSDEVLNFAFMAFSDKDRPLAFADITYGFYPVFAELNGIPYRQIPLLKDFSVNADDYIGINQTIVIANPNAPTGIFMPISKIEKIAESNPQNVIIIDEAYIDFGGQSAIELTKKYDNLLVCGTFSKSRSMAGARLGFGIGNRELIEDLNKIKYSTNPYNVNRMTEAAGIASLYDNEYYMENCRQIIKNREWTKSELEKLGFSVIPSKANFLFAKSDKISGKSLYQELKKRCVLIRHFDKERICDYNRITIGTYDQMQELIIKIKEVLKENKV